MPKPIDFTGMRIGRLLVIALLPRAKGDPRLWKVRCDCGIIKSIRSSNLLGSKTLSCGCLFKEKMKEVNLKRRKHPLGRDMGEPHTFESWAAMRRRCNSPLDPDYENYGANGISICERWRNFSHFLADMGPRPKGTTLDRYPNQVGNYEPSNCRWAMPKEQANNRRSNVVVEVDGRKMSLTEACEVVGLKCDTVRKRMLTGVSAQNALRPDWHTFKKSVSESSI